MTLSLLGVGKGVREDQNNQTLTIRDGLINQMLETRISNRSFVSNCFRIDIYSNSAMIAHIFDTWQNKNKNKNQFPLFAGVPNSLDLSLDFLMTIMLPDRMSLSENYIVIMETRAKTHRQKDY
jgi:hypothetical protein